MTKIAIVDDQREFLFIISKSIKKYYAKRGAICSIKTYDSANAVLFDLENESFDIYILDVEMPGFNGIRLAREIRKRYLDVFIIFVTAHSEYALEAFDVRAYKYIMKDQIHNRLRLENAISFIEDQRGLDDANYYIIETRSRYEKIPYKDILYLYKENKNSVLVTKNHTTFTRDSIQNVYKELDQNQFIFIDRGCIVNIVYIVRIYKNELYLKNDIKLIISRSHVGDVKKKVHQYWRNGLI